MKMVDFFAGRKISLFFENTLTFKTLINIKLADIIQEMRHKRCYFLEKKKIEMMQMLRGFFCSDWMFDQTLDNRMFLDGSIDHSICRLYLFFSRFRVANPSIIYFSQCWLIIIYNFINHSSIYRFFD